MMKESEQAAYRQNFDKIEEPHPWGNDPNDTSMMGSQPQYINGDPRPKNFPPCKPILHHDIKNDIVQEKRMFVRKMYIGWYVHCLCLLWNFIALSASLFIDKASIGGFFLALFELVIGPPIAFWVYWLLYSAIRKVTAFRFVVWMVFFVGQIGGEIILGLGISGTGGAGFLLMIQIFSDSHMVVGILVLVSTIMWGLVATYNIYCFILARKEYSNLGGNQSARKDFGKATMNAVYENRETIKQVAVENKDTIKKFAVENKDAIVDFARENKDTLAQVALDNQETLGRAAYDNRDAIFANADVVSDVFDQDNTGKR